MEISAQKENNERLLDFDDTTHSLDEVDEELTFSDWHFVERLGEQGSDDDSIEVIEREVLASSTSLSNTGKVD